MRRNAIVFYMYCDEKKKKKKWKRNVKETTVFEVHGNKLYNNGKTLCEE